MPGDRLNHIDDAKPLGGDKQKAKPAPKRAPRAPQGTLRMPVKEGHPPEVIYVGASEHITASPSSEDTATSSLRGADISIIAEDPVPVATADEQASTTVNRSVPLESTLATTIPPLPRLSRRPSHVPLALDAIEAAASSRDERSPWPSDMSDKRRPVFETEKRWETSTLIGAGDQAAYEAHAPAPPEMVRERLRHDASAGLKRKGFFSDMPDKGLFLAFALGGFGAISVAKYAGLQGLWVAGFALAALGSYAFLAFRLERFRANPDGLGDNCYYMGFLFTLASLSAALLALESQTANHRGDLLEALIGSFGVALFSTIGGITLRVFFMQMRREIVDLEEQLRTELQGAAHLLKDQLANAVMDLENLRLRTKQVLDQQLDDAAAGFTGVADALVGHISAAGSAYNAASERLATNADRVAMEVERLVSRVDKIDVPTDLLTRQVDDARRRIDALATALENAGSAGGQRQVALDLSAQTLDRLLTKLTSVTAFSDVENSISRLGTGIDSTTAKMASIGARLDQYSSSVGTIATAVEDAGQAVSRANAAIGGDLVQSTEALHKLQGTLADVADELVTRLRAPVADMQSVADLAGD